jgi:hypothetical protein
MKLAFSAKLNRLNDLPIASPLLQNAFFLVLLLLPVFSVRPVAARLLEGKIEHAEALPPVEEDFSVGKTFDPRSTGTEKRVPFKQPIPSATRSTAMGESGNSIAPPFPIAPIMATLFYSLVQSPLSRPKPHHIR